VPISFSTSIVIDPSSVSKQLGAVIKVTKGLFTIVICKRLGILTLAVLNFKAPWSKT
tara:strand:- start:402 stop:572 length:171 start_codon:yes stop_codon:yes gene_type:complete